MKELIDQLINEYGISRHEAICIIDALYKNITQKIFFQGEDINKNKISTQLPINNLEFRGKFSLKQ